MKQKLTILSLIAIVTVAAVNMQSCKAGALLSTANNIEMFPKLSDYHIFTGRPSDLQAGNDFKPYELSTGLFTDYAEKQRLIKVPQGFKLTAINNGLPVFPDGTILVKTFYYFNDKRSELKGKRIIETRLLIKTGSIWSAGTYQWNSGQTEAFLTVKGAATNVSWVDKNGSNRAISYHVPANKECATCHNSNNTVIPIGFKIRNLNIDVKRRNNTINQLTYFYEEGILNNINPSLFAKLSGWNNTLIPLEERARAYLDINCAHCHNENGYCSNSALRLGYETAFVDTHIANKKKRIYNFMARKNMPMLGTTIVDEEGISVIKAYLESLK